MKTYYMANDEHADNIFGDQIPTCLDLDEITRLAREFDMSTDELAEQFHEASAAEIAEYGIYE